MMTIDKLFLLLKTIFAAVAASLFYASNAQKSDRYYCYGQMADNSPKHEVRAVWLTTIGGLDWPRTYAQSAQSISKQQKELTDILDTLKVLGFNTVLFQTRIRATVIYPSHIEAWDGCCSGHPGQSPGYDPLAFAVEQCHKRGMEIHSWIVTIPAGKWAGYGCSRLRKKYPGMVKKDGLDGYIDPAHRMSAEYIASICREITSNYDIDGIHLDYIRYPETWKRNISAEQARRNITEIVRRVHDEVKSEKSWVKISCSPIGKRTDLARYSSRGWNACNKGYQDVEEWMRQGLMDQIYPMMYFKGNQFYPFALDWKEKSHGKTVVPGLGLYFLSDKEGGWRMEEITRQIGFLRNSGMGYALFRTRFLLDNVKDIKTVLRETYNKYPSMNVPTRDCRRVLPAPTGLEIREQDSFTQLSWTPASGGQPDFTYNIYASRTFPVDITDAANLIYVGYKGTTMTTPSSQGICYAVTTTDRYGNESKPLQQSEHEDIITQNTIFVKNDGSTATLPLKPSTLDADMIIVKSLQGNVLITTQYNTPKIDIRSLPDGMFTLHSLNRKGITHRLGFMTIKR
ncbi:MAG: glycoside hydrolase family 10 protein [Prevotella sp.]